MCGLIVLLKSINKYLIFFRWIYLEIETNPALDDDAQIYEAGFIEGALTQKYIYYHWYNTWRTFCDDKPKTCKNIDGFLNANTKWLKPIIKKYSKFDAWWHHVILILFLPME
jgi:hypothetical protein